MRKNHIGLPAVIACACFLFSCAWLQPVTEDESTSTLLLPGDPLHRRVVILPFVNSTDNEGLEETVRKSFYSHFSLKNYYDFELREVDSSLNVLEGLYAKKWGLIPAPEIGKFFHADFLIYGEVKSFSRIYLLFYSQIALTVKVTMVEAQRGRAVWEETVVKRMQSGDLPLDPLSFFPAAVRSGFNLAEARKMDLIERTCRGIAALIPEASDAPEAPFQADVQVASFSDKGRASQVVRELQERGLHPRIEAVRLKSSAWYRVLIGPFLYGEAEKIKKTFAADHRFNPILIHRSRAAKGQ